jgi:hypothetical protein
MTVSGSDSGHLTIVALLSDDSPERHMSCLTAIQPGSGATACGVGVPDLPGRFPAG